MDAIKVAKVDVLRDALDFVKDVQIALEIVKLVVEVDVLQPVPINVVLNVQIVALINVVLVIVTVVQDV